MKKKLFLVACAICLCASVMAEDVIYLTTAQFRERIFDYKTTKEWKYKGDKPCVLISIPLGADLVNAWLQ